MRNGWIKLHCQSLDNPMFSEDPTAWHLFETLLLIAGPGSNGVVDVTAKDLSHLSGIKNEAIRPALKRLTNAEMILFENIANRFTRITILNWDNFQSVETWTRTKSDFNTNRSTNRGQVENDVSARTKNDTQHEPTTQPSIYKDIDRENKPSKTPEIPISAEELDYLPDKPRNPTKPEINLDRLRRLNPEAVKGVEFFKEAFRVPALKGKESDQLMAVIDLLKVLDWDEYCRVVKDAYEASGQDYAPSLTSPVKLREGLADLQAWRRRNGKVRKEEKRRYGIQAAKLDFTGGNE